MANVQGLEVITPDRHPFIQDVKGYFNPDVAIPAGPELSAGDKFVRTARGTVPGLQGTYNQECLLDGFPSLFDYLQFIDDSQKRVIEELGGSVLGHQWVFVDITGRHEYYANVFDKYLISRYGIEHDGRLALAAITTVTDGKTLPELLSLGLLDPEAEIQFQMALDSIDYIVAKSEISDWRLSDVHSGQFMTGIPDKPIKSLCQLIEHGFTFIDFEPRYRGRTNVHRLHLANEKPEVFGHLGNQAISIEV